MSAEDLESQIEAAEEAGDGTKLLELISTCTAHGGDDDWTEVAEASLDALFRLAKSGDHQDPVANPGIPVLFASLAAWKQEEAIVEVGLGCLASLAKSYMSNADEGDVADSLDLNLLLTILKEFPDESTIQEQACLAMESLALVSDKLKASLKCMPGIQEELVAAKERITNERNKAYPGRAAKALGLSLE